MDGQACQGPVITVKYLRQGNEERNGGQGQKVETESSGFTLWFAELESSWVQPSTKVWPSLWLERLKSLGSQDPTWTIC